MTTCQVPSQPQPKQLLLTKTTALRTLANYDLTPIHVKVYETQMTS